MSCRVRFTVAAVVLASCTSCSRVLAPAPPEAGPIASPSSAPSSKPDPPACRPPHSVAVMLGAAHVAMGSKEPLALNHEAMTPLLPRAWPRARDGGVVAFVYRSRIPPTSRVTSANDAPHERIVFTSLDATALVEPIPARKWSTLREERLREARETGGASIELAQEALLAIVAGCRDPEQARADLAPYLEWDADEGLSEVLDPPQRAFFAWLREKKP